MADYYLGEFEHLVLLAILRLGDEAYGVTIREVLKHRAGRSVSLGAVYSALRRLEAKGLLDSSFGDPAPVRGGRAKKYFRLTEPGLVALEKVHDSVERMLEGVERLGWVGRET